MLLHKRVEKLEAKVAPTGFKMVHLIGQFNGQTEDDALDAYGRERIGADDDLIVLRGPRCAEMGRNAT